jgi:hypothetical protein
MDIGSVWLTLRDLFELRDRLVRFAGIDQRQRESGSRYRVVRFSDNCLAEDLDRLVVLLRESEHFSEMETGIWVWIQSRRCAEVVNGCLELPLLDVDLCTRPQRRDLSWISL